MPKGKALGPRVTVKLGVEKIAGKNVNVYSYMLKSTADFFGFKAEKAQPTITVKLGKTSYKRTLRGNKSNSIKIPAGKKVGKNKKVSIKYRQIPVGPLPLIQIASFVKKASKNKPTFFVSPDGRTYPIS